MTMPSAELYRLDPLTGSNNFLGFVESLAGLSIRERKEPFSILYIDMNHLRTLNTAKGHSYGDSVIRWMEIVLREESHASTYRIGGDEFTVLLTSGTRSQYEELLNRIFLRLNKEGEQLGLAAPVARIALIHYGAEDHVSLNDVLFQLGEAMLDVQTKRDSTVNIFLARNLIRSDVGLNESIQKTEHHSEELLRWIANDAIGRVHYISKMLEDAQKTSFIDSISGLPNMRAALLKIERELKNASISGQGFSILLMDGDNLTRYNNISYAVGDDMIQRISTTLSTKLRPGDFIARWRAGDEFIAVLPDTMSEGAMIVAERFCAAIREASQTWRFPTTISIGIATYPSHGTDLNRLVDKAEAALKKAKKQGKNRAVIA
jgi:diguanylate cyclase (GGDEF)-like protein